MSLAKGGPFLGVTEATVGASTSSGGQPPDELVAAYGWEILKQADLGTVAHSWLLSLLTPSGTKLVGGLGWPKDLLESVAAQAFLSHAGNVSKILFPATDRPHKDAIARVGGRGSANATQLQTFLDARRGGELVDRFGVGFSVEMRRRDLRDHLEHYDERLEEWAVLTSTFVRLEGSLRPDRKLDKLLGVTAIDKHRRYDEWSRTLWFWEEEYKLDDIQDELRRIREKVAAWLAVNTEFGQWMTGEGLPF
jgi:hypothetical protein